MSTPAGWYDDGLGRKRWWDGGRWTSHTIPKDAFVDGKTTANNMAFASDQAAVGRGTSVEGEEAFTFESEINGEKSTVWLFQDRIEWIKKGMSLDARKITAGVLTGGLSLIATGIGKGSYGANRATVPNTIYYNAITGISTANKGWRSVVTISAAGQTLPMWLSKVEAQEITRRLHLLITSARNPVQQESHHTVVMNMGGPAAGETIGAAQIAALANPETATALQNLQKLLYTRTITDEEYQAAKNKILG